MKGEDAVGPAATHPFMVTLCCEPAPAGLGVVWAPSTVVLTAIRTALNSDRIVTLLSFRNSPKSRGASRSPDRPARPSDEPGYRPATQRALTYSRVIRAMFEIGISFGQTASHSPSLEQLPNPSWSAWAIICSTRRYRSAWPCGNNDSCETLALMKRCAEAFLHAATHAPHPMQAAESIASSATSFGMG